MASCCWLHATPRGEHFQDEPVLKEQSQNIERNWVLLSLEPCIKLSVKPWIGQFALFKLFKLAFTVEGMSYAGMSETYLKTQQPLVSILGGVALPKAHILREVTRKRRILLPKETLWKGENSCPLKACQTNFYFMPTRKVYQARNEPYFCHPALNLGILSSSYETCHWFVQR